MSGTNLFKIVIVLMLAGVFFSCKRDPKSTGRTFIPDMQYSIPYDYYSDNPNFTDGKTAREPVSGTIPRGFRPYPYPNTNEGYELAGAELVNPIEPTTENLNEGKRIYTIYCQVCHGDKGDGQGAIVKRGVYPPPPDYGDRLAGMPVGKMYHSIYYGKNLMGSHASQIDEDERWKVIHYIQKLSKTGPFAANAPQE